MKPSDGDLFEKQDLKTSELFELAVNPRKLVLEGKKYGLVGFRRLLLSLFMTIGLNLIMVIVGLLLWGSHEFYVEGSTYVILQLAVGVVSVAFLAHLGYQFLIKKIAELIFITMSPFFRSVCLKAVQVAKASFLRSEDLIPSKLKNGLDSEALLTSEHSRVPGLIKKGVNLLINKIPFITLMKEMRSQVMDQSEIDSANTLYERLNGYLSENFFVRGKPKFVFWLIPLNVIIQFVLLRFI